MAVLLYHSQLLMHAIAVGKCVNINLKSPSAEACLPTDYSNNEIKSLYYIIY